MAGTFCVESVSQAVSQHVHLVFTNHVDEDLPCSTRSSAQCSVITLWEKNLENRESLYMYNLTHFAYLAENNNIVNQLYSKVKTHIDEMFGNDACNSVEFNMNSIQIITNYLRGSLVLKVPLVKSCFFNFAKCAQASVQTLGV